MGRKRIEIDEKNLKKLYWDKRLSPYQIGKLLNCSFSTITNRMKECAIPFRTPAQARMKYVKNDFNGTLEEKSYILGFRLGDLNCYKRSENSETIVVRCHTTDTDQVKLFDKLFKKYGKITISQNRNHYYSTTYLNSSFEFLLTKKFRPNNLHNLSFMAGYVDAEGNFQINQGRARFKLDSYDYPILNWMSHILNTLGIENKFQRIGKKGGKRSNGTVFNQDLWRITINKAPVLKNFIKMILPYIKHQKYKRNMKICFENIMAREEKGTIKCS